MPVAETCWTCKYFQYLEKAPIKGQCRRYPPQLLKGPGSPFEVRWYWPMVFADSFCGEFTQREDPTQ